MCSQEECRKRIETAMEESKVGKDRWQKTKERTDDRTAKAGEDMKEKGEVAPESDVKRTEADTDAIIEKHSIEEDKPQDVQEVELQEMPSSSTDRRLSTPDRKPAEKRRGPVDDGEKPKFRCTVDSPDGSMPEGSNAWIDIDGVATEDEGDI